MNGLLRNIERILRNRRTRRMLQRTISMFAAIVVFFTTYALVLPAITMEKNAGCGIEEHQHDDSCYEDQLICGLEESEDHQHTADCYERVLVCGKEAHTHSASCYDDSKNIALTQDGNLSQESQNSETSSASQKLQESGVAFDETPLQSEEQGADDVQTQADSTEATEDAMLSGEDSGASAIDAFPGTDGEVSAVSADTEPLDFAQILTERTGVYYDNSGENGSNFVKVHLAYTIPVGRLSASNQVVRYRLPDNIHLTDEQIDVMNRTENGWWSQLASGAASVSEEYTGSIAIEQSSSDNPYQEYLGAEAVEGTRTPDEELSADAKEMISAIVRAEEITDKNGEPAGQELIFTFLPYTIEKNRDLLNENGQTISAGTEVSGFFTMDLNMDQIDFDERGKADIVFAAEDPETGREKIHTVLKEATEEETSGKHKEDDNDSEVTNSEADNAESVQEEAVSMPARSFEDTILVMTGSVEGSTATAGTKAGEKDEDQKSGGALTGNELLPEKATVTVHVEAEEGTFPEGTQMVLSAVQGQDLELVTEAVSDAAAAANTSFQAVDISFRDADGNEIEPAKPVRVTMTSDVIKKASEAAEIAEPVVLHVDDDGIAKDAKDVSVKDDSVEFEGESFSVYAVVYTLEYVIETETGNYKVTVNYGPEAQIPEGARLEVTEYTRDSEEYTAAREQLIEAKRAQNADFDENSLDLAAMDITIVDSQGLVVEPATPVKVSLNMNYLPQSTDAEKLADSMEIQHFDKSTGKTIVTTVADASSITVEETTASAEFKVDSFSTFTISWEKSQSVDTVSYLYAVSSGTNAWYFDDQGHSVGNQSINQNSLYVMGTDRNPVSGGVVRGQNGAAASTDIYIVYDKTQYSGNVQEATVANSTFHIYFYRTNNSWDSYADVTVHYVDTDGKRLQKTQNQDVRLYGTSYNTDDHWIYLSNYAGNIGNYKNPHIEFRGKEHPAKELTVHYGYMDGDTFKEFDNLPEGAQTSYDGPDFIGDQLNLRYDIPKKDFVTVRINDPKSGKEINHLLQTEASSADYWRYRELDDKGTNAGINEWQEFGAGENDLYVIYRDTPTMTSTGVDLEDPTVGDPGAPDTSKEAHANGDGTYDISLSVTGKAKSYTEKKHANVVIVLDTSSSMFDNKTGDDSGEEGKKRLDVAKEEIVHLSEKLFSYNTKEDPNAIEVAMVDFAHRVRNETDMHTIYGGAGAANLKKFTDMVNAIPRYAGYGGTNYDTAIEAANSILWNDADPVYIVFITDGDTVSRGYLPYDSNGNTFPGDWDGGTYYNASDRNSEDHLARARSAAALQVQKAIDSGKRFYSIGVFGSVQYLKDMGGTYLGQANERAKISEAFDKLLADIQKELGYQDVALSDGITDLSSTTMISGSIDSFTYTVTDDLGNKAVVRINQDGEVFGLAVNPPKNDAATETDKVTTIADTATVKVANGGTSTGTQDVTGNLTYKVEDTNATDANNVPVKKITIAVKDNSGKTVFETKTTTASYSENSSNEKTGKKAVEWNLGPLGKLEDKWKYQVGFTVWPKQEAYDILADLNNGLLFYDYQDYVRSLKNGETALSEADAINQGLVLEEKIRDQIIKSGSGYSVKTNTYAGVSYKTVRSQDGGEDIVSKLKTGDIMDPKQTMGLDESKVSVEKKWDVSLAPEQLTRFLTENPDYEVELHIKNSTDNSYVPVFIKPDLTYAGDGKTVVSAEWPKETAYIAPGVMLSEQKAKEKGVDTTKYPCLTYSGTKYYLLETGHNYTIDELGSDWHFELDSQVYHPMVVDGKEREVSFTLSDQGAITGITAIDANNEASLTATNKLRSGLNIIKKVYDGDNQLISGDDSTFYVKLTMKDETGKEIKYSDYLRKQDYPVGNIIVSKEKVGDHYWLIKAKTGENGTVYTYYSLDENGSRQVDQNAYPIWYNDYAEYTEDESTGKIDGVGNWTFDSIWESGEVKAIKQGQLLQLKNIPYGTQITLTEVSPVRDESGNITGYTDIAVGAKTNGYKLLGIDGNNISADFNTSYKMVVKNQRVEQEIYFRKSDIAYRNETDETKFKTLDGAEFELYKGSAKLYFIADQNGSRVMTQNEVEALIGMAITADGAAQAMENKGITDTVTFCNSGNSLKLNIMDGTFRLKEIKAPDGFIMLENDIEFKVDGVNVTESSDYMDFRTVGEKPVVTVYNEPGAALPNTGGPGTRLFTLFGSVLIASAGFLLWISRKSSLN